MANDSAETRATQVRGHECKHDGCVLLRRNDEPSSEVGQELRRAQEGVCEPLTRQAGRVCEPMSSSKTTTQTQAHSSACDIYNEKPIDVAHLEVLWVLERACSASVSRESAPGRGLNAHTPHTRKIHLSPLPSLRKSLTARKRPPQS